MAAIPPGYIRSAIANGEELDLTSDQRAAIYGDNVRRLVGPRLTA
jgi:hypothetical protein